MCFDKTVKSVPFRDRSLKTSGGGSQFLKMDFGGVAIFQNGCFGGSQFFKGKLWQKRRELLKMVGGVAKFHAPIEGGSRISARRFRGGRNFFSATFRKTTGPPQHFLMTGP